jgi:staphylococcal nuclease domain-containing protein 1
LIAKYSSDTFQIPLKVRDQPKHTPSDISEVGVESKNHVVPLCSTWSSLFKDKVDTLKDEILVGTSEAEDLSANVPSDVVPFNPTKGDVVLAQFTLDNSWNRAMVMNEANFLHI